MGCLLDVQRSAARQPACTCARPGGVGRSAVAASARAAWTRVRSDLSHARFEIGWPLCKSVETGTIDRVDHCDSINVDATPNQHGEDQRMSITTTSSIMFEDVNSFLHAARQACSAAALA